MNNNFTMLWKTTEMKEKIRKKLNSFYSFYFQTSESRGKPKPEKFCFMVWSAGSGRGQYLPSWFLLKHCVYVVWSWCVKSDVKKSLSQIDGRHLGLFSGTEMFSVWKCQSCCQQDKELTSRWSDGPPGPMFGRTRDRSMDHLKTPLLHPYVC